MALSQHLILAFGVVAITINQAGWSQCDAGFTSGFGNPTFGEVSSSVRAMTVFDDGHGDHPALFVGGHFQDVYGDIHVSNIARFDGKSWSALGPGLFGGTFESVRAMAVYDDGTGPALFVGGDFESSGGTPMPGLAKWDGRVWSAVPGFANHQNLTVHCLTVYDSGSGPELIVGGTINFDGIKNIARWNGKSWSGFGTGLNAVAKALQVHDDTGGMGKPSLFVTGQFTLAGDVPNTARIAKWDGAAWQPLSTGLSNWGYALASYQGDLIVGGAFTSAGGVSVNRMAKWNGSAFLSMSTNGFANGTCGQIDIKTLHVTDLNGKGLRLYAGGRFSHGGPQPDGFAEWDGTSWTFHGNMVMASGDTSLCPEAGSFALTTYDDQSGNGSKLMLGGRCTAVGGAFGRIVSWNGGNEWSNLSTEEGVNSDIRDFAVLDDGQGPALFACGGFTGTGGVLALGIAKWNGQEWENLNAGDGFFQPVRTLATHDDGTGAALYAGGDFTTAGANQGIPGVEALYVAKWDGSTWSALGQGMDFNVFALASVNDGMGAQLFAGGAFSTAGGKPTNGIARWDGKNWWPLGDGVNGSVSAIAAFDDGDGPAVFACGTFTSASGMPANRIAQWKDNTWSALGDGLDGSGSAMTVYNDGNGDALYVGGTFSKAGAVPVSNIARWDGTRWNAVGSGVNGAVRTMMVHDDDHDGVKSLFVGGAFTLAGETKVNRIANWDGTSWVAVDSGVTSTSGGVGPFVNALASFDDDRDSIESLYVGGLFTNAGEVPSFNVAKWDCGPVACSADITQNGVVDVDDLLLVINSWGPCSSCEADITSNGIVDVDDLLAVINGWGACP